MADKRYLARWTQTGTDAPTAVIIKNDFDSAFVLTRSSEAVFVGTLADALDPVANATIHMEDTTDVVSYGITDVNSFTITMNGDETLTSRLIDVNLFSATPVASTHYCSQTDLENRISKQTLCDLTNDTANSTEPDVTVIDALLTNVDATIDGLAGQVYTVPFTTVPDLIKRIAIDLACFEVMQRRPINMAMPEGWKAARESAMKQLEAISNMLLRLPDTATIASAESNMQASNWQRIDFSDTDNSESDY